MDQQPDGEGNESDWEDLGNEPDDNQDQEEEFFDAEAGQEVEEDEEDEVDLPAEGEEPDARLMRILARHIPARDIINLIRQGLIPNIMQGLPEAI